MSHGKRDEREGEASPTVPPVSSVPCTTHSLQVAAEDALRISFASTASVTEISSYLQKYERLNSGNLIFISITRWHSSRDTIVWLLSLRTFCKEVAMSPTKFITSGFEWKQLWETYRLLWGQRRRQSRHFRRRSWQLPTRNVGNYFCLSRFFSQRHQETRESTKNTHVLGLVSILALGFSFRKMT